MDSPTIAPDDLLREVQLREQIARQRDQVLDLECHVDQQRQLVAQAIADLRDAVHERDRAAVHLGCLLEWYADVTRVA